MTQTVTELTRLKELTGAVLGPSRWLEITQERVNTFADATDDHQWVHVDVERAAAGPFGGPIAHGYLTLALVIPLWSELLTVDGVGMSVNYGLNRVRFPAPVPVGSKVALTARVAAVEEVRGGAGMQVTVQFTVQVAGVEKPAAVAEAIYHYYA